MQSPSSLSAQPSTLRDGIQKNEGSAASSSEQRRIGNTSDGAHLAQSSSSAPAVHSTLAEFQSTPILSMTLLKNMAIAAIVAGASTSAANYYVEHYQNNKSNSNTADASPSPSSSSSHFFASATPIIYHHHRNVERQEQVISRSGSRQGSSSSSSSPSAIRAPRNPFCDSTLCSDCISESSDPSKTILGDYCLSLLTMLRRGSTNVHIDNVMSARRGGNYDGDDGEAPPRSSDHPVTYAYIPPFEALNFNRAALTAQCSSSAGNGDDKVAEALTTAYGVDTASVAMAVTAVTLVCDDESAAMNEFLLKTTHMPGGVPVLGCNGYTYNGYTPANGSMVAEEATMGYTEAYTADADHTTKKISGDSTPALRDCYATESFSNNFNVPNIFENVVGNTLFPQGSPTLRSTLLKAFAIHSNKPALSLAMFTRLYPALGSMMVPTPRGSTVKLSAGQGLVIERPNATAIVESNEGRRALDQIDDDAGVMQRRRGMAKGSSSSSRSLRSQSLRIVGDGNDDESGRDNGDDEDLGAPTFYPGPVIRTMTKTLVPPEPTTLPTTSSEPATTTTTATTTSSTTAAPTTSATTTTPTTTSTTTTTTTTSTTTTTTPKPTTTPTTTTAPATTTPLPPVTTSPSRFQNVVTIVSQVLLYQWAHHLNADVRAAIPPATLANIKALLQSLPPLLEPLLCLETADMGGYPTAFPMQLYVAQVGPSSMNVPEEGIFDGYQTAPSLVYDSYTQLVVLATLGSKGLAFDICGFKTQTSVGIDRLLDALDYLAVRDPKSADASSNVLGMAASDPSNGGKVDRSLGVDAISTSLAIIAIQQVLADLQDTNDFDERRLRAQNYLDQLRGASFMTDSNCMVNRAAFWPPSFNSSFGDLMAMAGPSTQCGGETPSLRSTALWLMAVSNTNPFQLRAGFHPPSPNPPDNGVVRWFQEHKILFLSICGGVIFVVLAAVVSLIVVNSRRSKRQKEDEEDRRKLVNPKIIAAEREQQQQRNGSPVGSGKNIHQQQQQGNSARSNGGGGYNDAGMSDSAREKKNMGFF